MFSAYAQLPNPWSASEPALLGSGFVPVLLCTPYLPLLALQVLLC